MPPQNLTAEEAVTKLINASRVIQMRPGLKQQEEKRVVEAFGLLAKDPLAGRTKGARQKRVYLQLLRQVKDILGWDKVVLRAAIVGPSNVARMKELARVELPHKMKGREGEFECEVLTGLGDVYCAKFFPRRSDDASGSRETIAEISLKRHAYKLQTGDLELLVRSKEYIRGTMWLTRAYTAETSFVTIPISDELADQLTIQRRRLMGSAGMSPTSAYPLGDTSDRETPQIWTPSHWLEE
ncbi:hypothetical protein BDV25DRAFT_138948 [Aspergillus avenaceus]|uniref:Uncharacterized protein n=1 Tax=Aspergillus avenaceus TaxID=36643 RepID=A0A5N6TYB2_ASPAV|nr:hypothetical protein BDV25DRAFT_138948 [Aspergillus avenaceus]